MICAACEARLPSIKRQQHDADRDNEAGDPEDSQVMSSTTAAKKQRNIINEVEIATEKVMKVQKPSYARVDGDFTADTAITVVPDPVQKAVISHLKPGVHEIRRRLPMAC